MTDQPQQEIIVTQQQADGETVVQIIEVRSAGQDEGGVVDEVLDALFDDGMQVQLADGTTIEVHEVVVPPDEEGAEGFVVEALPAEEEGGFMSPVVVATPPSSETEPEDVQTPPSAEVEPDEPAVPTPEDEAAQRASEAQGRADAAVASGDYQAAAQERGVAEAEAWRAGDSSMLHGSTAVELDVAADRQESAEFYEREEARHAEAGDYAAARDDASNAANQVGWADHYAGGADHSGQARAEYDKQDWAVWEEGQAKDAAANAEWYAERGNADAAQNYVDAAADHQAQADQYGHEGQHGASGAVHDPSSDVAHDTPVGGGDAHSSADDAGAADQDSSPDDSD